MSNQLQSDNINEIAAALAKAQGEFDGLVYDAKNPHFKNDYATYDAVRQACRVQLSKHGICVTHAMDVWEGKRVLITQLTHISGQWMRSYVVIPQEKETPQSMGSAITYSKRYALSAMLAIASDEDDDAESAEQPFRAPASTITPMQEEDIIKLTNGNGEVVHNILKHYKCKTLSDLKASDFPFIINTLQKKKEGARHEAIAS